MPPVARFSDICTGHGCFSARPNDEGSPDVFVNQRPAHRARDRWQTHLCPDIPKAHDSVLARGSLSVFVNGRALGRIGDPVACGSKIATGSEDVYCGG